MVLALFIGTTLDNIRLLHVSAVKSHTEANQELVALLLEKGANSRLGDSQGRLPIVCSVE